MRWIVTISSILLLTVGGVARDWSFTIHPDSLRFISANGMKRPSWYMNTYDVKNLVNLSFFTGRGFIPPYKDDSITVLRNPLKWPYFCIGDSCYVRSGGSPVGDTTRFIVSGYPILIRDSSLQMIKRSLFTRRACPRTAVGVNAGGMVIVYVTTSADLKTLQEKMLRLGCVHAINLDGGSSTFLYLDGRPLLTSRQARSYPNILAWWGT